MKKINIGFGALRELDALGRVCIPKEMRRMFQLEGEVEIVAVKEGVLIKSPRYVLITKDEYEELKGKS